MIIENYLTTARVAATLLRAPEVAERWTQPSALAEFRISGLAGHLAAAAFRVSESLSAPVPAEPLVDAAEYFARAGSPSDPLDAPRHEGVRRLGESTAVDGPAALASRFDAAIAELDVVLPGLPVDRPVFGVRSVLRLDQWVLTRLVELVVHIDDLAVSVGVPTPVLAAEASDLVITTLARIAVRHHGAVAVVRSLSRRERVSSPVVAF